MQGRKVGSWAADLSLVSVGSLRIIFKIQILINIYLCQFFKLYFE